MKEELTREEAQEILLFAQKTELASSGTVVRLAAALLEEMDKPKDDVWKDAPEWATSAEVTWESDAEGKRRTGPTYTRELPKTRARQIAEEVISENVGGVEDKVSLLTDLIESALEKYAAELKGEE